MRFLRGELRLCDDDELDPRWRNRTFGEMATELQQRFRGYELVVRELPMLDEHSLREIFRRLNRTIEPLGAQQLRHAAYSGPFIQLVERAGGHPVLGEVGVFTADDYRRRRCDELMAEIAFAVIADAFPHRKEGLDALFLAYEKQGVPNGVLAEVSRRFGRAFHQLEAIAVGLRRSRFRNKPDFYTLFVSLARNAERLPVADPGRLLSDLVVFSERVNDLPASDGEDGGPGHERQYLGAVERAADDRLSRVRRHDALLPAVLEPAMAGSASRALSHEDATWALEPDDAVVDDGGDDDLAGARQALLADADPEPA